MFNAALARNRPAIQGRILGLGLRLQTIKAETVVRIKITVHTRPMIEPGGVQVGFLMVLYQAMPDEVSRLPPKATVKVVRGMKIYERLNIAFKS